MKKCFVLAALASLFCIGVLSAGVVMETGNHKQGTDNVLFNNPSLFGGPGTEVFGYINNPAAAIVQFDSTQDLLTNGGQARVEPAPPSTSFQDLQISLFDGGMFERIVFNLNVVQGGSGTATLTADGLTATFSIGTGENFFTIYGTNGTLLDKVQIATSVGLTDVRQIRIGGATTPVPEPGTWVLAGCALAGFALIRKRKAV